jgi:hypothetical protein
MTAPYQLPPIFLQLTMEEAFFFAKLIMPEGSPPEALSGPGATHEISPPEETAYIHHSRRLACGGPAC